MAFQQQCPCSSEKSTDPVLIDFTGTIYFVECISIPVTIKYQRGSNILLSNANTPLLTENLTDLSHSQTRSLKL